ncbi:hypothetical protein EZS27_019815 [termite gut metagenome]|uniref:Uncharacterized protein n=1 Tax=termite gut metagenome TaxID=433724 RepID=A0A5J4RFC8_9ZZZZ
MRKGIESLRNAVIKDCDEHGQGCFNPAGCNKESGRKCCGHAYCDKYKWVIERAEQYGKFTGKTKEEVIARWEEERTYWYMNFSKDFYLIF